MEITLAHPHHHIATAAPSPHHEAKLGMVNAGGSESSFRPPHHRAAAASKRALAAAVEGKAASVHKAAVGNSSSKNSKYKMKYHYVSMKRWEAYRYIDSLAQGSGYRPWSSTSTIPHQSLAMGSTVSPALGTSPPPNTRSAMIPIPSTGHHGSYHSAATSVVPQY